MGKLKELASDYVIWICLIPLTIIVTGFIGLLINHN